MTESTRFELSYLLYPPVYANFVPLIVIKSDFIRFYLHLLFAIRETHRETQASILDRDVQIIGAFTWNKNRILRYWYFIYGSSSQAKVVGSFDCCVLICDSIHRHSLKSRIFRYNLLNQLMWSFFCFYWFHYIGKIVYVIQILGILQ